MHNLERRLKNRYVFLTREENSETESIILSDEDKAPESVEVVKALGLVETIVAPVIGSDIYFSKDKKRLVLIPSLDDTEIDSTYEVLGKCISQIVL